MLCIFYHFLDPCFSSLSLSVSLDIFCLLMFAGGSFQNTIKLSSLSLSISLYQSSDFWCSRAPLSDHPRWKIHNLCCTLIPVLATVFLVGGWMYFHWTRLSGRAVGIYNGTIISPGFRPKVGGKQEGLNFKITTTLRIPGFLDLKQPNFASHKRIPSTSSLWCK